MHEESGFISRKGCCQIYHIVPSRIIHIIRTHALLKTIYVWLPLCKHSFLCITNLLVPIFATRKVGAPLSNILSCWEDQYSSIDNSNTNIRPLVIILLQNIQEQQYVALNSLLTTLLNRNIFSQAHGRHKLYCNILKCSTIQCTKKLQ